MSGNKNLGTKRRHSLSDGYNFFFTFQAIFFIYCFLCLALLLLGPFLIIAGNWANSGYFSLFAITSNPWPKVTVDDEDSVIFALEFLQLSCWISGRFNFFFRI